MRHTLVALVEDKPGVLNRVASLFRRRAFNIESLTVGHTERPGVSRMTIRRALREMVAEGYVSRVVGAGTYVTDRSNVGATLPLHCFSAEARRTGLRHRMRRVVEQEGGCIVWGGAVRLSPTDDILIRVERVLDLDSEGQLVASILSKKIAAGATDDDGIEARIGMFRVDLICSMVAMLGSGCLRTRLTTILTWSCVKPMRIKPAT